MVSLDTEEEIGKLNVFLEHMHLNNGMELNN